MRKAQRTMKKRFREAFAALPSDVKEHALTGIMFFNAFRESAESAVVVETRRETPITNARQVDPRQVAKLRQTIVEDIWESDLRAELVDRCVDLAVSGVVTVAELHKAIQRSKAKNQQFKDSGGLRGSESIWRPLGAWCKRKYEDVGRVWTKTNQRLEPAPPRKQRLNLEEEYSQ